jgi:hypothetical protein
MDGNKWRSRSARTIVTLTIAVITTTIAVAQPAVAGAQKVDHTERLFVNSAPIANQTAFNADHTPVHDDTNCSHFPGVFRGGKVWADTYVGGSHAIYSQLRMNFWTEYSTAVASAKYAYDRAHVTLNCPGVLNEVYKGKGTKYGVAASCGLPGAPTRWCDVYKAHPGDVALDLPLIDKCAPTPGGPYPIRRNEWHDLSAGGTIAEAKLYDIDALEQLSKKLADIAHDNGLSVTVPVYVDDITSLAGVRNFDHVTGQPEWGSSWLGYGHVQTPGISDFYIAWFDAAAQKIGKNPYTKPVAAHKAVQELVDRGQSPVVNGLRHRDVIDVACAFSRPSPTSSIPTVP